MKATYSVKSVNSVEIPWNYVLKQPMKPTTVRACVLSYDDDSPVCQYQLLFYNHYFTVRTKFCFTDSLIANCKISSLCYSH